MSSDDRSDGPAVVPIGWSRRAIGWLAVAALLIAGLTGYLLGTRRSGPVELTGHAMVGEHVATIEAEGWSYGVAGSVTWIDLMGAVHDRGWPSCFGAVGEVPHVRFGAVSVALPDNGSQRIVVYVDCRD